MSPAPAAGKMRERARLAPISPSHGGSGWESAPAIAQPLRQSPAVAFCRRQRVLVYVQGAGHSSVMRCPQPALPVYRFRRAPLFPVPIHSAPSCCFLMLLPASTTSRDRSEARRRLRQATYQARFSRSPGIETRSGSLSNLRLPDTRTASLTCSQRFQQQRANWYTICRYYKLTY